MPKIKYPIIYPIAEISPKSMENPNIFNVPY
jgi:hypothetical protein